MALKREVSKEEFADLPEPIQEHYSENGDSYVLAAEGFVPETEVTNLKKGLESERRIRKEFEQKHTSAAKRLKAFDGLDVEEAREALRIQSEMKDKKLIEEGKIEELIGARTERMLKDHKGQVQQFNEKIETLTQERDRLHNQLSETLIDNALRDVALKPEVGVERTAIADLILRGRRVWRLNEEGQPAPYDGENVIYGADPNSPMTMEEWIVGLRPEAPHLFGKSAGSGGNDDGPGGTPKKKRSEMTAQEKAAFLAKHGEEEFLKIPT